MLNQETPIKDQSSSSLCRCCSTLTAALPAQGVVGETYNRMLVGEAANDPDSEFYLPDDYVFRGKGAEADYLIDGYFGETANTMFGKVPHMPLPCLLLACTLLQPSEKLPPKCFHRAEALPHTKQTACSRAFLQSLCSHPGVHPSGFL